MLDEKSLKAPVQPSERHSPREGAKPFCPQDEDLFGRHSTPAAAGPGAQARPTGPAGVSEPLMAPSSEEKRAASTAVACGRPEVELATESTTRSDNGSRSKLAWAGTRMAILTVAVGATFPYFLIHLVCGHFYVGLTGQSLNDYMHSTSDASYVGLLLTVFGYAGLLRSFTDRGTNRLAYVARLLAAALLIFWNCIANGAVGGAIALACCLSWLSLTELGRQTRLALPESFRFNKAVTAIGCAGIPVALVTIAGIYSACTRVYPPGYVTHYSDAVMSDLPFIIGFMAIVLALPAYAVARCARTSAVKPLITLALLVHSPLLAGMTLQAVLMAATASGWQNVLCAAAAILCAALSVSSGAALAAMTNKTQHEALALANGTRPYF